MASKRGPKSSAAAEIDELFEGIGDDAAAHKKPTPKTPGGAKPKPGDDILAELENELGEKTPSRPHTPRIRETTKPGKRTGTPTTTEAARPSIDGPKPNLPRQSGESTRSLHASFTPSATSSELQDTEKTKGTVEQQQTTAAAGGGWWGGSWGGILSTATAAMKQAEAAVKEIQQNEEAKKWAEQVRGNVGALKGLGKSAKILCVLAIITKDTGVSPFVPFGGGGRGGGCLEAADLQGVVQRRTGLSRSTTKRCTRFHYGPRNGQGMNGQDGQGALYLLGGPHASSPRLEELRGVTQGL